jgi:hypothetical protein
MADPQIYSIQPRFQVGEYQGGWAWLDSLFQVGTDLPIYGDIGRDAYLSVAWRNEPILAGAISKWVEKVQSTNWKVSGGKNQANFYARNVFNQAENGRGWTFFKGRGGLQYLTQDKGDCYELGRVDIDNKAVAAWRELMWSTTQSEKAYFDAMAGVTSGRVGAIQNLDTTLLVKVGWPQATWRYFPEQGTPTSIPNANLVQNISLPDYHDRHTGEGFCAASRLMDAKGLMLGYLTYFREEVGDLPPELVAIINGLDQTKVEDSLKKYKVQKEQKGHDKYGKIWWLGSNDPSSPVSLDLKKMMSPDKSFNYMPFVEWWVKVIALNTGEPVSEYWLMDHPGNTGTLTSVQQMKSSGTGAGRYLQEDERQINNKILPFGVVFEYDNTDDEQDKRRAEILAANITNLKTLAETMAEGGSKALASYDELRDRAVEWGVLPPETVRDDMPTVISSTLKSMFEDQDAEQQVSIHFKDGRLEERIVTPILRGREATEAHYVYQTFKELYGTR